MRTRWREMVYVLTSGITLPLIPLYKAGPDSFGRVDDPRGTPLIPKGQTLLRGTFRNCKDHFQSGAVRGRR